MTTVGVPPRPVRGRIVAHPELLGSGSGVHLLRGTGMSNTYVLGRRRLAVVDPGAASTAAAVLEFVTQELGRRPADVGSIVVTHLHCDHLGGVAELAGSTGARVALPRASRPYVEGRKAMRWAPMSRWIEMMRLWKGTDFTFPDLRDVVRMPWAGSPLARRHRLPFAVDRWLTEGEALDRALPWRVLAAPGHTDDSICLHHPKARALVSGDTILGVDGEAVFNPFFAFDEDRRRTERRLRSLRPRHVLPGHGLPVTGGRGIVAHGSPRR